MDASSARGASSDPKNSSPEARPKGSSSGPLGRERWTELSRHAGRWTPPALLAATFLAMLWFSWGKWPDVLVDFGHELYVPWRLSRGQVLVRDIAWGATGPLSPYLNALLFTLFGVSLRILVVFNLVVLALITLLLQAVLRALVAPFAATLAGVTFLVIFAFGQYVGFGNYNYVTPYSHGITHGMILSLLGILLMDRYARRGSRRLLASAGACLGLVFLTKPEVFVACAAALALPLLLQLRQEPARAAQEMLVFGAATIAPPLAALLLLLLQLAPSLAWQATVAPWFYAITSGAKTNPFYLAGSGLNDPLRNLLLLLAWLGLYALLLVPAALLDRYGPARRAPRIASAAVASLAVLACLVRWLPVEGLYHVARPLPAVALAGFAWYAWPLLARREANADRPRLLLGAMMSAFAFGLLLKMILNARIHNYGFALAMPASVLAVAWTCGSISVWLRKRGGAGIVFQAVSTALVVGLAASYLSVSSGEFAHKIYPVGSGADAFLADERGLFVTNVMERLQEFAAPNGTLAVLPDGVMVNYLTRRVNPTPYLTFLADSASFFGSEAPLLDALQRSAPDLILLVHRDSSEHGAQYFGRDYARSTLSWILANYTPALVVGDLPLLRDRFGMLLLVRTTARIARPMDPAPASQ